MNIYDDIKKGQQQFEDQIKKSLAPTIGELVEDIKKAKSAQVGEVREWGGVKMQKTAQGWVPVKEGTKSPKEGESDSKPKASPEELSEHAKNASEQALMNATKTSPDPDVRLAAHKELQRRKNEEAGETFKAPEGGGEKAPEQKAEVKKEDINRPYKNMSKEDLHKLADKKAGRDRMSAINELSLRYEEKSGRPANMSALDRKSEGEEKSKKAPDDIDKMLSRVPKEQLQRILDKHLAAQVKKEPDSVDKLLSNVPKETLQKVLDKHLKGDYDKENIKNKQTGGKKEEGNTELNKKVQEWIGDEYSEKQINGVLDSFLGADISKKDFKVSGASNPAHESELVHEKVNELYNEVRPGDWPNDLKIRQIKDIIWGVIMSSK